MKKAILTKQQAAALENALACCDKTAIIQNHVNGLWSGPRYPLYGLPLETIIVATYIGYEIERTREEKLLAYIQQLNDEAEHSELIASTKLLGVMKTLEILDIDLKELKGVKN